VSDDWIKRRIVEANGDPPLVAPQVVSRVEGLLNGQLSERELSRGDITKVARELLAAMSPVPCEADAER